MVHSTNTRSAAMSAFATMSHPQVLASFPGSIRRWEQGNHMYTFACDSGVYRGACNQTFGTGLMET